MNHKTYEQILLEQQTPYLQWLKEHKCEYDYDSISEKKEGSVLYLPFFACVDDFMERYENEISQSSIIILTSDLGYAHEHIKRIVANYFDNNSEIDLMYADEDYLGSLQELYGVEETALTKEYRFRDTSLYRGRPWFKPEYSPDTLLSFFYFGNVIAFRTELLRKVHWLGSKNDFENIYDAVLQMTELTSGIGHLAEVLFTNKHLNRELELRGVQEKLAKIKQRALERRGCEGKTSNEQKEVEISYILYTIPQGAAVSIVIPSKDNAKVLERCLDTLIAKTKGVSYEVIVVDNGSSEAQQMMIGKLQEKYGFQYLYEKEEFNFSRMCNRGARAAKGNYLLFLNDDVEIIDEYWLERMLGQAAQPWTGAVGAKLYYPDNDEIHRIQHVGITNMGIGPAHKLGGMKDEGVLYHGHNCLTYNMLAVTAACLLVKRECFDKVQGFDEELAVAYNDVAFCMKLFEAGYYNVIRNDAVLIHHESLSRGQDDTDEKKQRLAKEKALLYEKHRRFDGYDPFYSRHLVQYKKDVDYHCHYLYPYDMIGKIEAVERLPRLYRNKLLRKLSGQQLSMANIDAVTDEADILTITGWYVLQRYDNALLDKYLILQNQESGHTLRVKAEPWLRKDVASIFAESEGTLRTELAGIYVHIDKTQLPKGEYRIGVLACGDKIQRLCWTDALIRL
ncbi:MAG: glycosyltransferase [Lachnospiraceae bacterium]|nr:glycosyltransferase [Lachnospiraceae bacterium]